MTGYNGNIEELTSANNNFRQVLFTGPNSQLVLMSLKPNEEIGEEIHTENDQFFRFEKGHGKYSLSDNGKEFANRMDTEALVLERQAKLGVSVHAERFIKGQKEILVHHRLKEPFYGWWGFNTGKIRWGETPEETAKRELLEETGLAGEFQLKGIVHYLHYHKDGRFLEELIFEIRESSVPFAGIIN